MPAACPTGQLPAVCHGPSRGTSKARELGRRTSRSRNHNLCTLAAGTATGDLAALAQGPGVHGPEGRRGEGDEHARVDGDRFGDALAPGEPGPDRLVGVAAVGFGAGRADGGAAVPARRVDHPVRQGVGVEGGQDLAGQGSTVGPCRASGSARRILRPRQRRTASESSRRGRPGRAAPRAERDQAVTQLPWRPVLSESPRYRRKVRHFPSIAASLTGQAARRRCAAHTVAPADRGDAAAWRQVCPADSITAHAECHQPVQFRQPAHHPPRVTARRRITFRRRRCLRSRVRHPRGRAMSSPAADDDTARRAVVARSDSVHAATEGSPAVAGRTGEPP